MNDGMSDGTSTSIEANAAFTVELVQSGQRLDVPADHTVLQVLEAAGIDVPMSCGQGICGTCVTRVLGGLPDHRDMYFTGEEQDANDQFTPCCSRSKTAVLRLDL
jgi:vanillate O-demethylase ferredoxin subunit